MEQSVLFWFTGAFFFVRGKPQILIEVSVMDRILRRSEVEQVTGLARATIYKHVNLGTFPSPVKLTSRAHGWKSSDIQEWIDTREELTIPEDRESAA